MRRASIVPRISPPTRLRYGTAEVNLGKACTVRTDTPVLAAAREAASHPHSSVVCVIDHRGRLVGLVPREALLESLLVRVAPEALLGVGTDVNRVVELARLIVARTAGDLMQQPASVVISAPAGVPIAMKQMHSSGLLVLPVVDEEGYVLGQIDKLELILASLGS